MEAIEANIRHLFFRVYLHSTIFSHTVDGDLTPLFSNYFDLTKGNKKEASIYTRIVENLGISPSEIVFFSDVPAE